MDTIKNKFLRGDSRGRHYWLTPPDIYAKLHAEFAFDFDPCPFPLPPGFNGLDVEWGTSNYCNIPFGTTLVNGKRIGATAWVRKAIEEFRKGKTVVLLHPADKWEFMMLDAGAQMRNLGDIKWLSIEDRLPGKGSGRPICAWILDARPK